MSVERQLPDGWRWVKFGDIAREVSESTRTPIEDGFERYVGLEHFEPDSLSLKRWGMIEKDNPTFTKVFHAGQLLFGRRRAYQRKAAIVDFDGICSGDIIVIEALPKLLLPDLLPFVVQSDGFWDNAIHTSAGSLSPRTKWANLAAYEFPLPPLDEQSRIAAILWAVEEAIEAQLLAIEALSFTKKVFARNQFNNLPIGTTTFSNIGDWLSGGTPSRDRQDFWKGDIPWVSPKDMKVDLLMDTEEHISPEGLRAGSRMLPKNSILFVTRGMILVHTFPVAMTGRPMAFNQDLKAVITYEAFDPVFVFYWLQHNAPKFLHLVTETSHGTKRLSTDTLAITLFPEISIEQQQQIARQLGEFDKQNGYLQDHERTLRTLKKRLLHAILVEGAINVQ
jgi:type I restriction enzyme S subunit